MSTPRFHLWFKSSLLALPFLFASNALGASTHTLDLETTIQLVKDTPLPLMAEYQLDLESAQNRIDKTKGIFYSPKFQLEAYTGVVPDAKGDVTFEEDSDGLGGFFKIDLKIIQPIYSFGKYQSAKEAAEKNIESKKAIYREALNGLTYNVIQAYIGVYNSREAIKVSEQLSDKYQDLLTHLKELLQQENSDIDDSYLLEAQSYNFTLQDERVTLLSKANQAELYLRKLLRLSEHEALAPQKLAVPAVGVQQDLLTALQSHFRNKSPLLQSYNFGLQSLKHKTSLENRKRYPDLFIALMAGYGTAPGRDEQDNAFVTDNFNYDRYGGTIGMKWDFNYHVSKANVKSSVLDYQKLDEKKRSAIRRQEAKIAQLHNNMLLKQDLLITVKRSLASAKSWLRLETDNKELGIGDIQRHIKASQNYYRLKGKVISCRYDYLMTLAQLAQEVGDAELFLQWVKSGDVQI